MSKKTKANKIKTTRRIIFKWEIKLKVKRDLSIGKFKVKNLTISKGTKWGINFCTINLWICLKTRKRWNLSSYQGTICRVEEHLAESAFLGRDHSKKDYLR